MSNSDILLEAGTNELEMLLFELPGATYGVNVAKVREVILPRPPTPVPESNPVVEGVLNLRGKIVPIISLRKYFDLGQCEKPEEQRIIIMEFSNVSVGFFVDAVDKIYRISWSDLSPVPEEAIMRGAAFTAIAQIENRIVLVIDFERIMVEVSDKGFNEDPGEGVAGLDRGDYRVLVVDDSHTIRKMILTHMEKAGYKVTPASDGQAAWELLEQSVQPGERQFDLVVSDIEMPRMDGLYLTRKIRESKDLAKMPVVLFSSLITPDNLKKGKAVGADMQISKPSIHRLPQIADELLSKDAPATNEPIGAIA